MALPLSIEMAPAERAPAINAGTEALASNMCKRLNVLSKNLKTSNRPIIFRVPAKLRKNKECFIEPSVVSIGPYHRGHKHLEPMEEIKWVLLQDILSRGNNKVTLMEIIEKIKGVQLQVRSCYSECIKMNDDSFVEMLILDGTFIIQFMLKSLYWFKRETGWNSTCIATDLILLENQIPFFIVESLWDLYFGLQIKLADLKTLANRLCIHEKLKHFTTLPKKINHLLHLCHCYLVPDMSGHKAVLRECTDLELCTGVIPCATELKEAGIHFRKKRFSCKMMDVTFQGGILEIPFINIGDSTKPLLFNLMALEQSDFLPNHLTSYVVFMDSLINTYHDVAILQKQGIIGNILSSQEEVADFFNQLCVGAVFCTEHYLSVLFRKVNAQYNWKYRRYRAKLMHNYFDSPWSILSLLAAFVLLVLTFAQTYFAGYAYFLPSQSPN